MDSEFLKLNEDVLCRLDTLDKSKVYLFNVEIADMPKDVAEKYLKKVKDCIDREGIVGIYAAMLGGIPTITAQELSKYLDDNKQYEQFEKSSDLYDAVNEQPNTEAVKKYADYYGFKKEKSK